MPDIEIAHLVDRLMRRIHSALNAAAPEFDTHRVGPGGGVLLLTLAEIQPARLQDLAKSLSRDKSQITRAVQALERKGLIERSGCKEDGRAAILALSAEGRAAVGSLQRAVAAALGDILSPLSRSQQETLRDLLLRI